MQCLWRALAVLFFVASVANAAAQTYEQRTPAPRSTDPRELRASGIAREVHERFVIGLDAETHERWSSAVAEFQRIIEIAPAEPQHSTAQYDLGIAYANLQLYEDAARQFRAALTGDPDFLAAMANLISVDIARNDLAEARRIADRFSAAAPDSARALYSHGIVALKTGDLNAAQTDFGRLLRSDPSYAVAHYDLGVAQAGLGQFPSAEQEFALAIDLAPTYARARFALGTVLLREGKRLQAKAAFDRAATDAANDPALHNLAVALRDAIKN